MNLICNNLYKFLIAKILHIRPQFTNYKILPLIYKQILQNTIMDIQFLLSHPSKRNIFENIAVKILDTVNKG